MDKFFVAEIAKAFVPCMECSLKILVLTKENRVFSEESIKSACMDYIMKNSTIMNTAVETFGESIKQYLRIELIKWNFTDNNNVRIVFSDGDKFQKIRYLMVKGDLGCTNKEIVLREEFIPLISSSEDNHLLFSSARADAYKMENTFNEIERAIIPKELSVTVRAELSDIIEFDDVVLLETGTAVSPGIIRAM